MSLLSPPSPVLFASVDAESLQHPFMYLAAATLCMSLCLHMVKRAWRPIGILLHAATGVVIAATAAAAAVVLLLIAALTTH